MAVFAELMRLNESIHNMKTGLQCQRLFICNFIDSKHITKPYMLSSEVLGYTVGKISINSCCFFLETRVGAYCIPMLVFKQINGENEDSVL